MPKAISRHPIDMPAASASPAASVIMACPASAIASECAEAPSANTIDYQAIRNTLSRYCLALDTQNWSLLRRVFHTAVEADYPFDHAIQGVDDLARCIAKRLAPVTSQHALTTQHIEILADGCTAHATTYFAAFHFGKGQWEGRDVTAWGSYVDVLVCLPRAAGEDVLPGASGRWMITKRTVRFMARRGEEGVMAGEEKQ